MDPDTLSTTPYGNKVEETPKPILQEMEVSAEIIDLKAKAEILQQNNPVHMETGQGIGQGSVQEIGQAVMQAGAHLGEQKGTETVPETQQSSLTPLSNQDNKTPAQRMGEEIAKKSSSSQVGIQKKEASLQKETPPPLPHHIATRKTTHTFADDLAKSLDTTDAPVVQKLLVIAKEREETMRQTKKADTERQWYSIVGLLFIVGALCAGVYTYFYVQSLTVAVQKQISIGVFPATTAIEANTTNIQTLFSGLKDRIDLPEKRPFLFNFIRDKETRLPLVQKDLLAFIEATPDQTVLDTIENVHFGAYDTGLGIFPFIIAGVIDNEKTSKALLIDEPVLLQQLYVSLRIPVQNYVNEVSKQFTSNYIFNIPVRSLSAVNKSTNKSETLLLYGYAGDHVLIIATNPLVLKAVYDTVIRQ